jgi:hypothetical protein
MPKTANSIAKRMEVLPPPMSPDKRTEPVGNSIVASTYERIFLILRERIIIKKKKKI